MVRLVLAVLLAVYGCSATAETMKTYKVTAHYGNKKIKGVPCTLIVDGQKTDLVTPGRFRLPVGKDGIGKIDELSCTYQGKRLKTDMLADKRTTGVGFDFEEPGKLVGSTMYFKENGGLSAFFTPSGEFLLVR